MAKKPTGAAEGGAGTENDRKKVAGIFLRRVFARPIRTLPGTA